MRHALIVCLAICLFPFAIICLIDDPRGERQSQRLRDAKRIGS